jgi:Protein of unknown function (DUF3108).
MLNVYIKKDNIKMNRFLTILTFLTLCFTRISADDLKPVSLVDETLTYDVIYKWGLINKVAGHASMTLRNDGDLYQAAVYARNASWANSIYPLRDTLYTTMTKVGLYPVKYTYIAHENGKYKKQIVDFTRIGNTFIGDCTRYRQDKAGGPIEKSTLRLEGQGMTVDLLSSFFYLRSLDFQTMKSGQTITVNIFSGSKKEKLTITYNGIKKIKLNGRQFETYYINFSFTRHGKESSAPMSGWISTDTQRIPLKVEGSLAVGKVRAVYTGPHP